MAARIASTKDEFAAMAYRRKQSAPRSSACEDFRPFGEQSSSLAASRDSSSASSSYVVASRDTSDILRLGPPSDLSSNGDIRRFRDGKDSNSYYCTSMKNENEAKYGFWGVLARKAKTMLEDDKIYRKCGDHYHQLRSLNSTKNQLQSQWLSDSYHEKEILSRNRTREFSVRDMGVPAQNNGTDNRSTETNATLSEADYEVQLKASRDIANKMADKVKILLRELHTIKADLTFTNERCAQLEEENKSLRENRRNGDNPADDDLVRLQMETLLAEKSRLANENTIYIRENMFLREIVEYHQLTTEDMVYLDENIEEDNSEAFSDDQFPTIPSPSHPIHELAPGSPSPSASLNTVEEPGLVDTELSPSSAVEGI